MELVTHFGDRMGDRNCVILLGYCSDSWVAVLKNRQWLFVFVLTIGLLFGAAEIISVVKQAPRVCDAPLESWSPPDVSLCPVSMGLWECIKGVRYARDDI